MLPVPNGRDNPFSSKRHIGYRNTSLLAKNGSGKGSTSNLISDSLYYPAATKCWYYTPSTKAEGSTHYGYYLPDMVDLLQIMNDTTLSLVNTALSAISGTQQSSSAHYWSSLRYSSTYAWYFYRNGFSDSYYFYYGLEVRPVAFVKL